jgi:hypothetical protein
MNNNMLGIFVLVMNTINQSINQYLPHTPATDALLLLQYTFTKCLVLPSSVQYDVIQFSPSAGSDIKLLPLKSNSIYYIIWLPIF